MDVTSERCLSRRVPSILATIALVAATFSALAPGAGAVANTCRARNITQGEAGRSKLQAVINAASPGDTIAVRYRCVGNFYINKPLTLVGRATPGVSRPVLDADGAGAVLAVNARVTLINLLITGGHPLGRPIPSDAGGGITHFGGTLVLQGTLVRGNTARKYGGGIYNSGGTLILNGSSSVSRNRARQFSRGRGGGIFIAGGIFILNGSSSVSRNRADHNGGGIYNSAAGTLILNGSSSVSRNTAGFDGGGIENFGTLILNGSSSVSRNTTPHGSGGIGSNSGGTITMNGSSSVSGNTTRFTGGGIFNRIGSILTLRSSSSVRGNTTASTGGGISNAGTLILNGSSSVRGNRTGRAGGGIFNDVGSILTLRSSSSVRGNTASTGGGISNRGTLNGCDSTGADEWTGAISPNTPEDPPTVTLITCT
jgi:hypothetical protein